MTIWKVALVAPAGTVTFAGSVAIHTLLDSETDIPPLGAAEVSATVPVELFPPTRLEGFKDSELRLVVDVADAAKVAAIVWFAATLVKV